MLPLNLEGASIWKRTDPCSAIRALARILRCMGKWAFSVDLCPCTEPRWVAVADAGVVSGYCHTSRALCPWHLMGATALGPASACHCTLCAFGPSRPECLACFFFNHAAIPYWFVEAAQPYSGANHDPAIGSPVWPTTLSSHIMATAGCIICCVPMA